MKALILAGGRGTRLRPLTHTKNKHLLPIGNTPMILRVIQDAIDLGIKEIIININKNDQEIPSVLGNGEKYGVKFHYIQQPEPNGMMYPIKLAQEIIGNENFLFSAGDNILAGGLKKHFYDFKTKNSDAHVLVVKRDDYQQFGVAVVKEGQIIKTIEKPKKFISNLVLTAIYFFTPKVFKAFDHIKPIDPKGDGKFEYYPPPVINWLVQNNYKFTASEITGWWKDTGRPMDLILANEFVLNKKDNFEKKGKVKNSNLNGKIEIKSNSQITNSQIIGPVSIGKNVQIHNSFIGKATSIGDNTIIENANIANSIILGNNIIKNVKTNIRNSLIGWNAQIQEQHENPKESSLFIGDDSIIKL